MSISTVVRAASSGDASEISLLHARVFGPGRFVRTAYRVREGAKQGSDLCFIAVVSEAIVGSITLTPITIGGRDGGVLVGPFVVDPSHARQGIGRALMAAAIARVESDGGELIVLVGDEPYYAQHGFVRVPPGQIVFPGPVDPNRIHARPVGAGKLDAFFGMVQAVGEG